MVRIGRVVWPGPVGIGAGIVKSGVTLVELSQAADAVEVGSITRHLCPGNSGQTVWKYPAEKAIRHNAGLPNPGAEMMVKELKPLQYQVKVPWGLNVAVTPVINETAEAAKDISQTVEFMLKGGLQPHWLTINVSSPDTADKVEMLTNPVRVRELIKGVQQSSSLYGSIPVWLKVAPMLSNENLASLVKICLELNVEAIIATNTMPDPKGAPGGWAGEPLRARARAVVWQIGRLTEGKLPIIGCGGITQGNQVLETLAVGASAVQVVSALLFRGRKAAAEIRREYDIEVAKAAARQ